MLLTSCKRTVLPQKLITLTHLVVDIQAPAMAAWSIAQQCKSQGTQTFPQETKMRSNWLYHISQSPSQSKQTGQPSSIIVVESLTIQLVESSWTMEFW
jgi:hypothetical protein